MTDSFWTGGPAAYAKGIKVDYQEKLAELTTQLQICTDDDRRKEIEQEINKAKSEFRDKLGGSCSLLF